MRFLIHLLLSVLPLLAAAQSRLAPCPSDVNVLWHNCFGTLTSSSGQKYTGEFKDDKQHGRGTLTFPNGHRYVGEFKDGKRHGQGMDTFPNGEKYVGEFKEDSFHGRGTWTHPNGQKYVGEFRNDERNGQGTLTLPNGEKYEGEFADGYFQGKGTWTHPNGERYVGEFKNDNRNGWGTYSFPNGHKYVGEFRDGKRHGLGTDTFPSGVKYVGEFKEDEYNGQGIEYGPDGTGRRSGLWSNGNLTQSFALDTNRFPFQGHSQVVASPVDSGKAERERLAAQAESAQRRQRDLEQKLAAESKERQRQALEIETERRRRQELEEQLANAKAQNAGRPQAQVAAVRSAHALVIGNAAYPGSARLDNPVNDAHAVSQRLRSMGFVVTTVLDANRQRLVQAMAQFRRSAAGADLSLLFYSGHGVQVFGKNYMLPTDVDQSDPAQATIQGLALNDVIESFLPGKTKLVFLDACRDNPLQRTGERSVTKGLAPISVAQGTLISYATKDGQTASDGVGSRNSPFTQALLEHIGDPQDIGVVLRKVREKVMRATGGKQQPWEYGSLTGGELILSAIRASGPLAPAATVPIAQQASAPAAPAPLQIAFAYVGPVGDGGWTFAHEQGRKAVEREFGARVSTTYIEKIPESAEAETVFRDLASRGNKLIFGTTFGYMEPMLKIAREFPEVKFEHATGYKLASNMRTYDSRNYESSYLAGIIAGQMTRSNVLGVVAPIPIPEVIRNINSFTLGAQSSNPNIRTRVIWVNEWFNPAKESEAANALIQGGADVLFQNTDSSAVLQTAQKMGKLAFGWDSDMSAYAPDAHLGSAVNNWGPYYIKATREALEGKWTGNASAWWGVKEGAVDLVSLSEKIPPETRLRVEAVKAGLKDGSFEIWRGPLSDNRGRQVLGPGARADDRFLAGMKFYVRGVDGRVPGAAP